MRQGIRKRTSLFLGSLVLLWAVGTCGAEGAGTVTLKLPPPQRTGGMPLLDALAQRQSTRSYAPTPIPRQTLSNLLWAAFGINRPAAGKRTAPSSYNWQDITIYVFLPAGVYTYDAEGHELVQVKEGDHRKLAGMQGYVWTAPLSFVYVSDFEKMKRKGQTFSRAYKMRIGCIDAGHISQNVYLFCAANQLGAVARASVDAEQFAAAFALPESQVVILGQTVGFRADDE